MLAMRQGSPRPSDLSRPRLKQLASWIRDELDPVIAQNGPDVLRADDVLTLHEMFLTLRDSSTINVLDLRATGIHRAVMEVSGTATRWPGRLADDCDQIIEAWTAKFGRLEELHPFMYGRGGRLEGIASLGEFTKAALLKRWQAVCPEKIDPKVSHRQGDLGFKPGAWWMNPLFAHYSGIIDLAATDGGICFDQKGAYALVLQDTGEIESSFGNDFSYRCKKGDRGKYRLTSASVKSRESIRVLRCHNLNCLGGPKAGIRYEGLHRVTGWSIFTAKKDDPFGKHYKAGDVLFEVRIERIDPVPFEEVTTHPTSAELDDYTEYKRLRRTHRERRKGVVLSADADLRMPAKNAPPIGPVPPGGAIASLRPPSSGGKSGSPSTSRASTFLEPLPARGTRIHTSPSGTHLSPSASSASPAPSAGGSVHSEGESPIDSIVAPFASASARPGLLRSTSGKVTEGNLQAPPSPGHSSGHSGASNHGVIREVAPWIDYDLEQVAAAPSIIARANRQSDEDWLGTPGNVRSRLTMDARTKTKSHSISGVSLELSALQLPEEGQGKSRKPSQLKKKETRLDPSSRSRNPLAKLFDGADGAEDVEFSRSDVRPASFSFDRRTTMPPPRHIRASSSECTVRPWSPIPVRPMSPISPLITDRRDEMCWISAAAVCHPFTPMQNALAGRSSTPSDDPFVDADVEVDAGNRENRSRASLSPFAMKDFISAARTAAPVSVSPGVERVLSDLPFAMIDGQTYQRTASDTFLTRGLRKMADMSAGASAERVVFRNPFKKNHESGAAVQEDGDVGEGKDEGVETLAPHETQRP